MIIKFERPSRSVVSRSDRRIRLDGMTRMKLLYDCVSLSCCCRRRRDNLLQNGVSPAPSTAIWRFCFVQTRRDGRILCSRETAAEW